MISDDILASEITSAGVQIGLAQNQGKYYYLKDALGSVTDIANGNGDIVQRYDYESFGKIRSIKDGSGTDVSASPLVNTSFTFTGRELDQESGLYYYRARYYDAGIGRFLQKDPDPGRMSNPATFNSPYIYALNRPSFVRDPNGRFPLLIAIAVAAAVGGTIGGLTDRDGNFLRGFTNGALIGAGSVLAVAGGAAVATWALGAAGIGVGAGTAGGIAAGAIGGAIGNTWYFHALGARGTSLALAALSGGLSGGIAGAYGANFGQGSSNANATQAGIAEGIDSHNRTLTPISVTVDPYSYIHDIFVRDGNGWTNGAGAGGAGPVHIGFPP